jgi:hypothetical protein
LSPNGKGVCAHSRERYGPIPLGSSREKRYRTAVGDGGSKSAYLDISLLGSRWTGEYRVSADGDRVEGFLACEWAAARETVRKAGELTDPALSFVHWGEDDRD